MQALLCGVLQVVVQKLTETEASKAEVLRQADRGMELLLVMLRAQQASPIQAHLLEHTCAALVPDVTTGHV